MPTFENMRGSRLASMVVGVFDGLSARIAERAGFDALWASGLCISASKGIPDMSILSLTELVDKVAEIAEVAAIPIIVDCDEGYGSLPNTLRLVKQLAARGAQGICLEDNAHPKTNSFYLAPTRALVSIESFSQKIRAVKEIVPEMLLIARTEAIIAGLGLEEAVRRGMCYSESGADFVLLHSKCSEPSEFEELAKAWTGKTPLAVIVTMSRGVTFADLARLGFRMVIYGNQALRASVCSLEEALNLLHVTGDPSAIAGEMVSLDHIFELTGMSAMLTLTER